MKTPLERQFWDAAHAAWLPGTWSATPVSVKRALDLEKLTPDPNDELKKLFAIAHELDDTLEKTFSDPQAALDAHLKGKS